MIQYTVILGIGDSTPIMENQMEKTINTEMETGMGLGLRVWGFLELCQEPSACAGLYMCIIIRSSSHLPTHKLESAHTSCWDDGKENGNYYLALGFTLRLYSIL